jgi:predicted PurR-regulated permease PerM
VIDDDTTTGLGDDLGQLQIPAIPILTNNAPAAAKPLIARLAEGVLVGLALLLLHLAAPVANPIFFALYIVAIVAPILSWLQQKGLKSGLALLLLIVGILAAGVGVAWLAWVAVQSLQAGLSTYGGLLSERVAELPPGLVRSGATAAALTGLLAFFLGAVANVAANFFFSVVLVAFILLERRHFARLADAVRDRPLLGKAPELANTAVRYFSIRTRLNLVTGACITVLLFLLGVDYPLLWGVCGFLLSYIPYIGLATAMLPPALLAWAESGPLYALLVIAGITALNFIVENVLEPSYTGKQLRLSPTAVLVSFFCWVWLLGPVGAVLSMPITVLLMLVFGSDEKTRWLADAIGRDSEQT